MTMINITEDVSFSQKKWFNSKEEIKDVKVTQQDCFF